MEMSFIVLYVPSRGKNLINASRIVVMSLRFDAVYRDSKAAMSAASVL